jgi:nitroreductase
MQDMSVFDAIHSLRAVRKFRPDPIAPRDLEKVLLAASMAGSALNTQPWDFLVLDDPALKARFAAQLVEGIAGAMDNTLLGPDRLVDGAGRPIVGAMAGGGKAAKDVKPSQLVDYWTVEIMRNIPLFILVFWNPERGITFPDQYRALPDGRLVETKPSQLRGASVFLASQNLMLAAHALGIGTLFTFMHIFRDAEIKKLLGIPPQMFLEAVIFAGYSAEKLGKPRRKPLASCTHVNLWQNMYTPPAA